MEDLIAIKLLNVYIARYPQNVPPCALIHFWAAEMAWSIIPLCWHNGKGLHEPGPPPFRLTTIRLCVLSLLITKTVGFSIFLSEPLVATGCLPRSRRLSVRLGRVSFFCSGSFVLVFSFFCSARFNIACDLASPLLVHGTFIDLTLSFSLEASSDSIVKMPSSA